MLPKYWMVHTPGATTETRYHTVGDAQNAAQKYAESCPTLIFYVLEVVSAWTNSKNTPKPLDIKT